MYLLVIFMYINNN